MKLFLLCAALIATSALTGATAPLKSSGPASGTDSSPLMTLFIGSYTNNPAAGISVSKFNPETGELSAATIAAATPNPSFLALHPNGRQLFAVNESGTVAGENNGGVSVFSVSPDYSLTPHSAAALPGGPCHIAVDASGKFVLAATYGAGTIAAYEVPAGAQTKLYRICLTQHAGSGADPNRQGGPHAHQVVFSPDNRFVLAADLGLDKLLVYRIENDLKSLVPHDPASVVLPAGSGPRHMAFHPDGKFFYVAGEIGNTVTTFSYEPHSGKSAQLQHLSTLPDGYTAKSSLAEIDVHPSGRFLYVSNRGHDSIARFAIGEDGLLKLMGHTPTEGLNPRHFTFDPTGKWLLVANADSGSITVFKINDQNGDLKKTSRLDGVEGQPVCLLFASQP